MPRYRVCFGANKYSYAFVEVDAADEDAAYRAAESIDPDTLDWDDGDELNDIQIDAADDITHELTAAQLCEMYKNLAKLGEKT